jgi:hypothetical protein
MRLRIVLVSALAVTGIACGAEPPARVEDKVVGGLVPVADTIAEVHRHAAEAAQAAGAPLVVVKEEKQTCDSESVHYTRDVYRIEADYKIDVSPAQRKAAVDKIRALWKSQGLKLEKDPAPNDVEAGTDAGLWKGLQPAREGTPLPLYVNSGCHTTPTTP